MKVLTNPLGCSVCHTSFALGKYLKEHVAKNHLQIWTQSLKAKESKTEHIDTPIKDKHFKVNLKGSDIE